MFYVYLKDENSVDIFTVIEEATKAGYTSEPDAIFSDEEFISSNPQKISAENGKIYLGFTPNEQKINEVRNLKNFLISTDYIAIKIAEGVATKEEYTEVLKQRQDARVRINELTAI